MTPSLPFSVLGPQPTIEFYYNQKLGVWGKSFSEGKFLLNLFHDVLLQKESILFPNNQKLADKTHWQQNKYKAYLQKMQEIIMLQSDTFNLVPFSLSRFLDCGWRRREAARTAAGMSS